MARIERIIFLVFITLGLSFLEPHLIKAEPLSAVRKTRENYQSALSRVFQNRSSFETHSTGDSAFDQQTSFQKLNLSSIPQVPHLNLIHEMYKRVREIRAWTWGEMPTFPRRLTWLYPEDGCFLRAELMVQKLKEWGYLTPKQVFAFGELSFSTPYETVNWWYHVAPAVRFRDQVYIIDPAVDYQRPLLIQEWIQKISGSVEVTQFTVCEAGAVSPDDSCHESESNWDEDDRKEMLQNSLQSEWSSLEVILGSSPSGILGDSPPWRNATLSIVNNTDPVLPSGHLIGGRSEDRTRRINPRHF